MIKVNTPAREFYSGEKAGKEVGETEKGGSRQGSMVRKSEVDGITNRNAVLDDKAQIQTTEE